MADEVQMLTITIDGKTTQVPKGTTILQAARKIGPEVAPPTMCYYSSLENSGGKCRTCLVEVVHGSTRDPRPMPKLMASCRTDVQDGMVVRNRTSERVIDARNGIVEYLLINHPLDCPVCDQAGECDLQDLNYNHGLQSTRTDFVRRVFEPEDIGPYIQLHMNRCILCYRCVLLAEQLTEERQHGVLDRGERARISTGIAQALESEFYGNVIDVCPVGALTDKTFRFKNRVWFTKPMDAHRDCPKCCGKVRLWMRGDEVFRVTGRKNIWGEVEEFICNDCRFHKKKTSDWIIEGPSKINRHSVIAQGHYADGVGETPHPILIDKVIGKEPIYKLDIHDVSGVNKKEYHLDQISGPPHSDDYDKFDKMYQINEKKTEGDS